MKKTNKIFLYAGLSLLVAAFAVYGIAGIGTAFYLLLTAAILLKSLYLIMVFRQKGIRLTLGMTLIILGVVMILTSLLFKSLIPIPWLRNLLFYGAITLKVLGLLLTISEKRA
ncbi:MAG: hypothetical protein LBT48_09115 [Prevotellaceae bacterium]|jgi:hypothetical protein|nr:hypothetical protein [Prevotellaceae bacterium]